MIKPCDPPTRDEYNALQAQRVKYDGYFAETSMVMPCPFCCAEDHLRVRVLDTEEVMQRGAKCSTCGRAWCAVFQRSASGVQFEIVQTQGDDPPDYLPPMRRHEPPVDQRPQ